MNPTPRRLLAALMAVVTLATAACGDDDDGATADGGGKVRLIAHDSFALSQDVLDAFTDETGITVEVLQGGDAGTVVNQAILAKGKPQADVLFGIDSTFLTRALDEEIFVPYEAADLALVNPSFLLDPDHRVTPIDYGDVCLNYDKAWFAEAGLAPPTSLQQLTDPAYRDLLVVENPATSSPGLAFLLATVDAFGEDGWESYWEDLVDNGVAVTDDWEDAYYGEFSGGLASEGTRPIVVSYASSPPVEVVFADPPVTEAPTGVVTEGCYRQIEAAGILAGTEREEEARRLIDFLLSEEVQADVPLSMYVYPVRDGVALPEVFTAHAAAPTTVAELEPAAIDENREAWIAAWTEVVLG